MNEHQRERHDQLRAIARSQGGACLSREYHNAAGKLRWRCAEGHEWEAAADSVHRGTWCRICAHEARYAGIKARTFSHIQAIAREKGGLCLSTEYVDSSTCLRWRCAKGHEWEARAYSVERGNWCWICTNDANNADAKARVFARVQAIAQEKGGLCLTLEYVSCRFHLRFRCAEGHEWQARAPVIQKGSWCPTCAFEARCGDTMARVFARVQAMARERGGLCLSTEYVNSHTHLRFRCAEGHEWPSSASNISSGYWCPRCAGRALTIEDMRELARARGGRCLSRRYRGDLIPLRWRCAEGHEWEACQGNVRRGTWCPHCAGNAPKTITDVQALAAGHGGVCLSTTIKSNIYPLRLRCRVGHEFRSNAASLQQGKWCPRCRLTPRGTLERLRNVVRLQGGLLLDTEYRGSTVPVRVRCREGHEWSPTPATLINGRWCRACSIVAAKGRSKPRPSIVDMQELAASRGGRCLSEFYVNVVTPLRWQCHDGHEWDANPTGVRAGRWCPVCAYRHRGTIDAMHALAAERGGTCRSRTYRNHTDQLRFTCARGHDFNAPGMAVKSGAWCPTCGEWDAPPRRRPTRATSPSPT